MNFWFKLFLINWLLNILAVEFLALRKIKNIINIDEARDSKFQAFRRLDTKWFTRWWLFPLCHFAIIKVLFCFSTLLIAAIVINISMIGTKRDEPIVGWRYSIVRFMY